MEERDYFKRQLNQMARALGKVLTDLLGLESQGKVTQGIEVTYQALKSAIDFDVEEMMALPADELIDTLKKEKNLNDDHISTLADILLLMADAMQDKQQKQQLLYERCLSMYEYLETTATTYSFDRHLKIDRLKDLI